jgi:hypothetical protein
MGRKGRRAQGGGSQWGLGKRKKGEGKVQIRVTIEEGTKGWELSWKTLIRTTGRERLNGRMCLVLGESLLLFLQCANPSSLFILGWSSIPVTYLMIWSMHLNFLIRSPETRRDGSSLYCVLSWLTYLDVEMTYQYCSLTHISVECLGLSNVYCPTLTEDPVYTRVFRASLCLTGKRKLETFISRRNPVLMLCFDSTLLL